MSIENNIQLMKRFVEFINTANEHLAQELISTDARFYVPGQPEPMQGPDGYLAIIGMMRSGFPDIQWSLEDKIIEELLALQRHGVGRADRKGDVAGVGAVELRRLERLYIVDGFRNPLLQFLKALLGV